MARCPPILITLFSSARKSEWERKKQRCFPFADAEKRSMSFLDEDAAKRKSELSPRALLAAWGQGKRKRNESQRRKRESSELEGVSSSALRMLVCTASGAHSLLLCRV